MRKCYSMTDVVCICLSLCNSLNYRPADTNCCLLTQKSKNKPETAEVFNHYFHIVDLCALTTPVG